ncbi:pyridoxamine 5'-phosphate oxidase family protein [Acanthopleuribacter pedis]|uniref:Pyridoxamine 5'-phosphate oxidase family protein n=1 Tax=Acanthopleuribacter pedis TaxID=442870 RepID=A0A8J7QGX4_9BACT|nr:pyridoxamine 5'-phosphate oxidase family protein [Acanthopleuribacter pedis]MBO1318385.1 pyridoxamine 5'-phosphate oxidase family protein [Acanthopleuribacter pedis]
MTAQPPNRFHRGEQAIQARLGVREKMAKIGGRVIRDFMPDQHRAFFENQALLYVGALDGAGFPRASLLAGRPGFVRSPDPQTLHINSRLTAHDPLAPQLRVGAKLGFLGLEFHSRRRNRVNGTVRGIDAAGVIDVAVDQSFGNCPKYIQTRLSEFAPRAKPNTKPEAPSSVLTEAMQALLQKADTFFIASAFHGQNGEAEDPATVGVDVSHRGGPPGFVQLLDERRFAFPDYQGNLFFNTLGNLQADPRSGFLFLDFENGHLLQLIGHSKVVWEESKLRFTRGAERMVTFELTEAVWLRDALPFQFTFTDYSPHLPQ